MPSTEGFFMSLLKCKRCEAEKDSLVDFYVNDKTCKDCRKALVRENRKKNADYYREYDRKRFKEDPKVRARHKAYQETDKGRESVRKAKNKWRENNLIKRAVHVITGNAIRDGKIKKGPCEVCGSDERIHAHHDDYAQPLSVRWLCAKHHEEWHNNNGEGANAS
jgi:hypothetical protein